MNWCNVVFARLLLWFSNNIFIIDIWINSYAHIHSHPVYNLNGFSLDEKDLTKCFHLKINGSISWQKQKVNNFSIVAQLVHFCSENTKHDWNWKSSDKLLILWNVFSTDCRYKNSQLESIQIWLLSRVNEPLKVTKNVELRFFLLLFWFRIKHIINVHFKCIQAMGVCGSLIKF